MKFLKFADIINNIRRDTTFDITICLKDLKNLDNSAFSGIIDVTNQNITTADLLLLNKFTNKDNIIIKDTNWFGGVYSLNQFLFAENLLHAFAKNIKDLPVLQKIFVCHKFVQNLRYNTIDGLLFQTDKSYVDILNYGYCTNTGRAVVLKRLLNICNIPCILQGEIYQSNVVRNHIAKPVVYIKDDKNLVDGLYYCNLDYSNVNGFLVPVKDFSKTSSSHIKFTDYIGLDNCSLSAQDLQKLELQLDEEIINNLQKYINCNPISSYLLTKELNCIKLLNCNFISNNHTNIQNRENFVNYLNAYFDYYNLGLIRDRDCAGFVNYAFKNYFNVDVLQSGFGGKWTGKMMTSSVGKFVKIDKNLSDAEKLKITKDNIKPGDILFFHTQSLKANHVTEGNAYPGHCAIYLGNGKYIDSRLTTRGGLGLINMGKDEDLADFIGYKDIQDLINKETEHALQ